MARVVLDQADDVEPEDEEAGGDYFVDQKSPLDFVKSGSPLLDCVLGGGWPLRRISNLVGDESTGKTLIAIEAMANFHRQYDGLMFYREAESAFDLQYAETLGMPVQHVSFVEPDKFMTIEDFYNDVEECCNECIRRRRPGIYFCDSLDGLSDVEEMNTVKKEGFSKGTYGVKKAKDLHKMMRLQCSMIAEANVHLGVISQTKDKINAQFPTKTRSGGRALNFFASQALWLSQRDKVWITRSKIKRVIGVTVRAQMKKSKIALPYRECDVTIRFGQGIDSMASDLDWLEEVKRLDEVIDGSRDAYEKGLAKMPDAPYWDEVRRVDAEVVRLWREIEGVFMGGARRKYAD
ncbi:MAG: hypothetical protein KGO96_10200 [Elusimicrobia bacterium]|nr:hypothetical protein [Elusimicrobiota bacterium]